MDANSANDAIDAASADRALTVAGAMTMHPAAR
jgi:hypothetical protein